MRTRVGYTGGATADPTYHNLGDHSEALQLDYDPSRIEYERLLDVFWESHHPAYRSWSRQYRSAIFFHNDRQKKLAVESRERLAIRWGSQVHTEIEPAGRFYLAEDYHQKYSLRRQKELVKTLRLLYPGDEAFIHTTAAARINGFLSGFGSFEMLQAELCQNLTDEASLGRLLEQARRFERGSGLYCA